MRRQAVLLLQQTEDTRGVEGKGREVRGLMFCQQTEGDKIGVGGKEREGR